MRFDWLDEMVKEGHVSSEAANFIMADCRNMVKEGSAASDAAKSPGAAKIIEGLLGAGFLAHMAFGNKINQFQDVRAMKKTQTALHADPELGADKGKVDARFKELIEYAPAIVTNFDKTKVIIKKHLSSGFSNADIEKLKQLQAAYASAGPSGGYSGAHKYESNMSNRMMKKASAEDFEMVGHTAHDIHQILEIAFSKEAGVFKRLGNWAGKKWDSLGRTGDIIAMTAAMTGVQTGLAATSGLVSHVKDKVDQDRFKNNLEKSFRTAVQQSDTESAIRDRPEEARRAFNTLVHFAPNVAAEPQAARAFMGKILEYKDSALHPDDLKGIVEIERNYRQANTKPSPFFSAFSSAGKMVGLDKSISQGVGAATAPHVERAQAEMQQELGLPNAIDKAVMDAERHTKAMS